MNARAAVGAALVAGVLACTARPERPEPREPATAETGWGAEPRVEATGFEAAVTGELARGVGRPRPSATLALAARALAARVAAGEPDPLAPRALRAALVDARAWDPGPRAWSGSGGAAALAALAAREGVDAAATHFGVGAVERGATTFLVVLSSRRRAALEPFPRRAAVGARVELRGRLLGLRSPRVAVTAPSGATGDVAARGEAPFVAGIALAEPGRHVVEVLGSGAGGPEVAAILVIDAGDALAAPAAAPADVEPDDLAAAEAAVVDALNRLRASHGLPPLASSPALAAVARRHSADMLAQGTLAHVLPGSGDVAARLRRAGVPFRRAAENVARAGGALAAHRVAEDSPAHRANMLDPAVKLVGCGIARGTLSGGERAVYLTEVFVDPATAPSPEGAAAELRAGVVRAAPRLAPDPELDALASAAAERMARTDRPDQERLTREALDLGRRHGAAEVLAGDDTRALARSRHVANPRFRRFGVGAAAGRGRHAGQLWIALVLTD
jgi:uncharacterized protein YkwD